MTQLEEPKFEVKTLLLPMVQVVEGAQDNLQIAGQLFFAEQERRTHGAGTFVAGDLQQLSLFAAQLGQGVCDEGRNLVGGQATRGCGRHSPGYSVAPSVRRFGWRPRLQEGARR